MKIAKHEDRGRASKRKRSIGAFAVAAALTATASLLIPTVIQQRHDTDYQRQECILTIGGTDILATHRVQYIDGGCNGSVDQYIVRKGGIIEQNLVRQGALEDALTGHTGRELMTKRQQEVIDADYDGLARMYNTRIFQKL